MELEAGDDDVVLVETAPEVVEFPARVCDEPADGREVAVDEAVPDVEMAVAFVTT